jgi:integrase
LSVVGENLRRHRKEINMATPTKRIKVTPRVQVHSTTRTWQAILEYYDETGTRKRPSKSTGLPERGNKKRAETMAKEFASKLEEELNKALIEKAAQVTKGFTLDSPFASGITGDEMLVADLVLEWLESINPMKNPKNKKPVKLTTFCGYEMNVQKTIVPYFRKKGTLLSELTYKDIDSFYDAQLERVTAMTVTKFHANISLALKYAFLKGYISSYEAIMKKVTRPTPDRFTGKFLKESETVELLNAAKGHKLELGVLFGAFYGLRRSELVGLRWESINFEANTITIEHTVTVASIGGKTVIIADDTTKTKSSYRTLPLIPIIRAKLLEVQAEQEQNRKLCGKAYNKAEGRYIYTDVMGNRIKPDYLSSEFPKFLEKRGFRRIRFHDLRHSCASLLLANGVSIKEIQDWLGHSTFKTTADIYAHLDADSKRATAAAMSWIENTTLAQGMTPAE